MLRDKVSTARNLDRPLVIKAGQQQWVVPSNYQIVKMLLEQENIRPEQLCFESDSQCKSFVKRMLLMALADETKSHQPSSLAEFARCLIFTKEALQ